MPHPPTGKWYDDPAWEEILPTDKWFTDPIGKEDLPGETYLQNPAPGTHQLYLLARCLILGAGVWLAVNGAAVFFLIKDHLPA